MATCQSLAYACMTPGPDSLGEHRSTVLRLANPLIRFAPSLSLVMSFVVLFDAISHMLGQGFLHRTTGTGGGFSKTLLFWCALQVVFNMYKEPLCIVLLPESPRSTFTLRYQSPLVDPCLVFLFSNVVIFTIHNVYFNLFCCHAGYREHCSSLPTLRASISRFRYQALG